MLFGNLEVPDAVKPSSEVQQFSFLILLQKIWEISLLKSIKGQKSIAFDLRLQLGQQGQQTSIHTSFPTSDISTQSTTRKYLNNSIINAFN